MRARVVSFLSWILPNITLFFFFTIHNSFDLQFLLNQLSSHIIMYLYFRTITLEQVRYYTLEQLL